jgi:hypothetical protein
VTAEKLSVTTTISIAIMMRTSESEHRLGFELASEAAGWMI